MPWFSLFPPFSLSSSFESVFSALLPDYSVDVRLTDNSRCGEWPWLDEMGQCSDGGSGIFGYINYLVEKDRKYILDTLVNGRREKTGCLVGG